MTKEEIAIVSDGLLLVGADDAMLARVLEERRRLLEAARHGGDAELDAAIAYAEESCVP